MSYETLMVDANDGVVRITLNQPKKLNALSIQLLGELNDALAAAEDDADCRCVVLTGAGRGFSSGADLMDSGAAIKPGERFDFGAKLDTTYHPIVRRIRSMPKPVIAAINGIAAGAGCNIALAADVVVATRSATFMQAFIRIGLIPDASGTWTIPRLIGRARAMRWMMSGERIDAETAERWGLISAVYDDESFADDTAALARTMAAQPTVALAAIKQLVDESTENTFDEQIALESSTQTRVGYSDDTMEGISAFIQKREAQFKGQ